MKKKKKMDSKWKKVLLGAIIFVAILIVGFLIYFFLTANSTEEIKTPTEKSFNEQVLESCLASCENKECEEGCNDEKFLQESKLMGDDTFCSKIKNENVKVECEDNFVFTTAISNLDSTFCAKLSDEDKISSCNDGVLLEKAINQNDSSLCDSSFTVEGCKNTFYLRTNQCEKILDSELKTECVRLINI